MFNRPLSAATASSKLPNAADDIDKYLESRGEPISGRSEGALWMGPVTHGEGPGSDFTANVGEVLSGGYVISFLDLFENCYDSPRLSRWSWRTAYIDPHEITMPKAFH